MVRRAQAALRSVEHTSVRQLRVLAAIVFLFAMVIASEQGVDYVEKNMPRQTTTIWASAVDEELTSRAYIVPGIGDAGDLAYGSKI